jgi:hypothetical protein
MAKTLSAAVEKIEVLNLSNSNPPLFNRKKEGSYLMWKIKFEVDMVMKGLFKAFQPKFETELPTKEK